MLDQEDEGTRIGVWVALGVVAFVLFGLIGGLAIRSLKPAPAVTATTMAAAAMPSLSMALGDADAVQDVPLSGDLIGKVYFAVGQADVDAEAQAALQAAAGAITAAPAGRILLAGFHDPTGDAAVNAELAKNRAKAVREALKAAGVDAAAIVLRKPERTTGDGTDAEARRVEMRLLP